MIRETEQAIPTPTGPKAVALNVRGIQTALFAFCLSVFLLTFNTRLASVDAVICFETTASLAERGTFAIDHPQGIPGRDGRLYSKYGPLLPLVSVPLYAAGSLASRLGPLRPHERHLKRAAVSLLNPVVTALLAAMVLGLALRLGLSRRRATGAALLFAFGTIAWYYTKTFFSEPLTALLLVAAFTQAIDYRRGGKAGHLLASGIFAGLAATARPSALAAAPIFLILALPRRGWRWADVLRFGAPVGFIYGLLVLHNLRQFGSPFMAGYTGEGFTTPVWVGVAGLLASPRCGTLFYSPLMLLAVPGLYALARQARREALAVAALSGMWLVVNGMWWCWWGGGSWGPRFLLPLFPFLSVAAVAALPPLRRASRPLLVVATLLAIANAGLQVTSILVTNARWEYGVGHQATAEGGDPLWRFRYMPLVWQARAAREVLMERAQVTSNTVMLSASEVPPESSASVEEDPAGILRRIDMHVVDTWPVLFALYGLPARLLMAGVLLLLAAAGASLALLLNRLR